MCGLTGLVSLDGTAIQAFEVSALLETLHHRGPNHGAVYVAPDGACGLGLRRLSIIDVAGGNQPLYNEDQTIGLVYNGETYNHRDLRAELERLGHRPNSYNDGEVVLHGYEAWGPEGMLQRLRGMVALALWDASQRCLLLARDRFGIKPLYYAQHKGRLCFGSEIKAILAQPDFPRRVNLDALQAMLHVGFVPGPATMFAGIYKLPPAHFLLAQDGRIALHKYWQLDYQINPTISEAEATEEFLACLREAVNIRLMSEVPLGALLSGGLDSGTLVSLLQAGLSRPLKTVSIGFAQEAYDEADLADKLAATIGTDHYSVNFTAKNFDDYPTVMRHLESPQCFATALPIYTLYQACRQAGLTVVLTGEGADELLGGYQWHRGDALMRPLLRLPAWVRRWAAGAPLPMSTAARRVLRRGSADIATRYCDWLEIPGEAYRQRLLIPGVEAEENHLPEIWATFITALPAHPALNRLLWLESQTRMVDFINFEVDRMSMAHSIEARVPFLDHRLWEFCATLPAHYKLKGRTEKYLLRQAAQSLLPDDTRTRRKKGLAAPYSRWLQSPRLPDWAETLLSDSSINQIGLFCPPVVQQLRQAHQAGQPALGSLLMGVLSTQLWAETFL